VLPGTRVCAILILLAGCQAGPSRTVTTGAVLFEDDFSKPFNWDNRVQGSVQIGVKNGVYEMHSDVIQYVRGFNNQVNGDTVIQVEARQLSTHEQNAYGIVCRASPANVANGYYFLIAGNGFYSIRRGEDNSVDPLVDWALSGAINRGTGRNVIKAICADDYLALYVNYQFVAEARDPSFKTGFTGLAVATSSEGEVLVIFDNLVIWEARSSPLN
jgi:hypothetical protein